MIFKKISVTRNETFNDAKILLMISSLFSISFLKLLFDFYNFSENSALPFYTYLSTCLIVLEQKKYLIIQKKLF